MSRWLHELPNCRRMKRGGRERRTRADRDGRNQRDFMMHIMASISYFRRAASSLARIAFGHALKAKLLDPAAVGLLDRNDVVVEAHLLACVREVANPMNDIAADGGYILILPLQTRQVPH